ncbi:uncharacterized protein [Ptychodera flava]|uniref:uncharacterized protein n=1 Tax=Ptychodera flava TaxID=63121 RepID=UPI00396AABDA
MLYSNISGTMATLVSSLEDVNYDNAEHYRKDFVHQMSRLLVSDLEHRWKQIYQEYGSNVGPFEIFSAIETLTDSLYDVILNSGQEVSITSDTIELRAIVVEANEGFIIKLTRKENPTRRRLLQWPRDDIQDSFIQVPRMTLEKINALKTTGTI